jgi:hypothetical protein
MTYPVMGGLVGESCWNGWNGVLVEQDQYSVPCILVKVYGGMSRLVEQLARTGIEDLLVSLNPWTSLGK